jgi:uncharacterized protein YbaP (TraB family)
MTKLNLFKLSKRSQELHIFGTAHNLNKNVLPSFITDFIIQHPNLVTENQDVLTPISNTELVEFGFITKELSTPLSSFNLEQQRLLRTEITRYGEFKKCNLPIEKLNYTGLFHLYQMASYHSKEGMDFSFVIDFMSKNKRISGLETRRDLMKFFEVKSQEDLNNLILESNYDINDLVLNTFREKVMASFYLQNLCVEKENADGELRERNTKWLPKIIGMSSDDIICVGADHLFYEFGLLNMLRLQGYSITRINALGQFSEVSEEDILAGIKIATNEEYQKVVFEVIENLYHNNIFDKGTFESLQQYISEHTSKHPIEVVSEYVNLLDSQVDLTIVGEAPSS